MVGKASPELSAITAGSSTIWAIAAGLTGPIFQGGRIFYNYRATRPPGNRPSCNTSRR